MTTLNKAIAACESLGATAGSSAQLQVIWQFLMSLQGEPQYSYGPRGAVMTNADDMPPYWKTPTPICKVNGLIANGAMCGSIMVGSDKCGFDGPCSNKEASR